MGVLVVRLALVRVLPAMVEILRLTWADSGAFDGSAKVHYLMLQSAFLSLFL